MNAGIFKDKGIDFVCKFIICASYVYICIYMYEAHSITVNYKKLSIVFTLHVFCSVLNCNLKY